MRKRMPTKMTLPNNSDGKCFWNYRILSPFNQIVIGLHEQSITILSTEKIHNVATISANNDAHIGGIFDKLGPNGTITVTNNLLRKGQSKWQT